MIFTIYEHRYVENSWLFVPYSHGAKLKEEESAWKSDTRDPTLLGRPFDVLDPYHAEVGDVTVGFLLRVSDRPIDTFERRPPFPPSPTTCKATRHHLKMLLFTPLISLFFFSGFAVAGIAAPDCPTAWN